jgi:hypothetical protein
VQRRVEMRVVVAVAVAVAAAAAAAGEHHDAVTCLAMMHTRPPQLPDTASPMICQRIPRQLPNRDFGSGAFRSCLQKRLEVGATGLAAPPGNGLLR